MVLSAVSSETIGQFMITTDQVGQANLNSIYPNSAADVTARALKGEGIQI